LVWRIGPRPTLFSDKFHRPPTLARKHCNNACLVIFSLHCSTKCRLFVRHQTFAIGFIQRSKISRKYCKISKFRHYIGYSRRFSFKIDHHVFELWAGPLTLIISRHTTDDITTRRQPEAALGGNEARPFETAVSMRWRVKGHFGH